MMGLTLKIFLYLASKIGCLLPLSKTSEVFLVLPGETSEVGWSILSKIIFFMRTIFGYKYSIR